MWGPHLAPVYCDIDTRQAQQFIGKPWGLEIIWAKTGDYIGKVLFIKKEHRLSYQYHEVKEETIFLMEGALALEYENGNGSGRQMIRLKAGESFHIPPKMKHRMIGITDCKVLEVSTPHLDDVVRLEDQYGRT